MKKIKEAARKFFIEKAVSIILTLLGSLVISVAGHIYGTYKLGEAVQKQNRYHHERDSLRAECINKKYGD